ncbi:MAG: hypothetical protein J5930_00915 [Treponema sp.]|nr:hypothetical protein [Treponema sp.]
MKSILRRAITILIVSVFAFISTSCIWVISDDVKTEKQYTWVRLSTSEAENILSSYNPEKRSEYADVTEYTKKHGEKVGRDRPIFWNSTYGVYSVKMPAGTNISEVDLTIRNTRSNISSLTIYKASGNSSILKVVGNSSYYGTMYYKNGWLFEAVNSSSGSSDYRHLTVKYHD